MFAFVMRVMAFIRPRPGFIVDVVESETTRTKLEVFDTQLQIILMERLGFLKNSTLFPLIAKWFFSILCEEEPMEMVDVFSFMYQEVNFPVSGFLLSSRQSNKAGSSQFANELIRRFIIGKDQENHDYEWKEGEKAPKPNPVYEKRIWDYLKRGPKFTMEASIETYLLENNKVTEEMIMELRGITREEALPEPKVQLLDEI